MLLPLIPGHGLAPEQPACAGSNCECSVPASQRYLPTTPDGYIAFAKRLRDLVLAWKREGGSVFAVGHSLGGIEVLLAAAGSLEPLFEKVLLFNPMVQPAKGAEIGSLICTDIHLGDQLFDLGVTDGSFKGGYHKIKLAAANALHDLSNTLKRIKGRVRGSGLPAKDLAILLSRDDPAISNNAAERIVKRISPPELDAEQFICHFPDEYSTIPRGAGAHTLKFYSIHWNQYMTNLVLDFFDRTLHSDPTQRVSCPKGTKHGDEVNLDQIRETVDAMIF